MALIFAYMKRVVDDFNLNKWLGQKQAASRPVGADNAIRCLLRCLTFLSLERAFDLLVAGLLHIGHAADSECATLAMRRSAFRSPERLGRLTRSVLTQTAQGVALNAAPSDFRSEYGLNAPLTTT